MDESFSPKESLPTQEGQSEQEEKDEIPKIEENLPAAESETANVDDEALKLEQELSAIHEETPNIEKELPATERDTEVSQETDLSLDKEAEEEEDLDSNNELENKSEASNYPQSQESQEIDESSKEHEIHREEEDKELIRDVQDETCADNDSTHDESQPAVDNESITEKENLESAVETSEVQHDQVINDSSDNLNLSKEKDIEQNPVESETILDNTVSEKNKNAENYSNSTFEEVDSNVTLNKSSHADEFDVLSEDHTQYILDKEKINESSQSPMEVDEENEDNSSKPAEVIRDNLDDASKTTDSNDVEMIPADKDTEKDKDEIIDEAEKDNDTTIEQMDADEQPSKDDEQPSKDDEQPSKDDEQRSKDDEQPSKDGEQPSKDDEQPSKDATADVQSIKDKQTTQTDETVELVQEKNIPEGEDEVDKTVVADTSTPAESTTVRADGDQEKDLNETQGEDVEAEAPGESADVCLIPDNDEELTGAEKEQAILARQNAEKEDAEKEAEKEATEEEQQEKDAPAQSTEESEDVVIEPDVTLDIDNSSETPTPQRITITSIVHIQQTCVKCNKKKSCEFRYKNSETDKYVYICEQSCIDALIAEHKDKYFIRRRKYMVEDLPEPVTEMCILCKEEKTCKYNFKQDDDSLYICNDDCFNLLTREEPDKLRLKRNSIRVKNLGATMSTVEPAEPKIVARTAQEAEIAKLDRETSFIRRCASCALTPQYSLENLKWQTLDFCNQICLTKYQHIVGDKCRTCLNQVCHASLGKYCVRFGFEICQFCSALCLDKYKKSLKNCSYCQKDISGANEGFLAPVGDNEQFKDFCSQSCMKKYDALINPKRKSKIEQCSVCNNKKNIQVELSLDGREVNFCSNPCFSAFKFVNNIIPDKCTLCANYFERKSSEHYTIYNESGPQIFCGKTCLNMFISQNRKIVFCQWCKVKKYNFDMIEKQTTATESVIMCSINCLVLYGISLHRITKQKLKCDNCMLEKAPQYHLTMSDSSMRNFCTYQCVMQFQSQFSTIPLTLESEAPNQKQLAPQLDSTGSPFPTGLPKRIKANQTAVQTLQVPLPQLPTIPVIANITSLAGEVRRTNRRSRAKKHFDDELVPPELTPPPLTQIRTSAGRVYTTQIMQPKKTQPQPVKVKQVPKKTTGTMTSEAPNKTAVVELVMPPKTKINMNTMCKPATETLGITCKPVSFDSEIQTDEDYSLKKLIPVPVPIYIPHPIRSFAMPTPIPVPFFFPIPIPVFIPTTRNASNGIMKEIKKIQDKMPADPFEAELLMMAELVAGDKKKEESESDEDNNDMDNNVSYNNEEIVDTNNSYGEDVLQMALKMATEYDEPAAVDLESTVTTNRITQPAESQVDNDDDDAPLIYHQMQLQQRPGRGKKRTNPANVSPKENNTSSGKRQRRNDSVIQPPSSPTPPSQSAEKPDANMCLKFTFGVNAWKQWVMTKNSELEKSSIRRKPFKSELLQMTADELNYSLCLFVKEVRKPNGTEYAPDTIYYLILGIQQYLYENGRIDNIFTDPYYERFTDCLDEVAKKFSILYNDSQYIVTRVEEEHLWECKQLGAHSPHVLLSTLMFFNTKHFNLTSVEEHMQLSFSHIMKHWKRNSQGAKQPGSRNVLLRFYPPQAGQDTRKKKVYEQQENESNPLRCPVRLYEFYLSKCPESVKTRNDVFYLQPERSCVPDSPVWYSTQALGQDNLQKMLHRVKMVKEINVALLTV